MIGFCMDFEGRASMISCWIGMGCGRKRRDKYDSKVWSESLEGGTVSVEMGRL